MVRNVLLVFLFLGCLMMLAVWVGMNGHHQAIKRGNEAITVSTLKTIGQAQQNYSADHGGEYGTFQQLIRAGYLDERYDSYRPRVYSYAFTMTVTQRAAGSSNSTYCITADPDGPDAQVRHFYFDVEGRIHVDSYGPASANDPLLDDPELNRLTGNTPKDRD